MGWNDFAASVLKGPLHGLMDADTMLVTMTGRKTGKPITTPVNYVQEGNTLWVTSKRERTWWRNLRGGAAATLVLKGNSVAARGEAIENDDDVAAGFTHYFELRPKHASTFHVKLGMDGKPDAASLSELVKSRLIVKFTLDA
jgi:deazaflavin-dependent oxidoreductase (nitroreductase family)